MSLKLDYPNTFKKSERDFDIPRLLLLGPGPSNCSPRVYKALAQPTIIPITPAAYVVMDEIIELLKYTMQTKNKLTLALQNSGHGGIEALITNLVEPGEKVIIAVAGVWGERTVQIAKVHNVDVVRLVSEPGEVYSFEELEEQIIKHKPVMLFVTHGESSGGTLQPLDGLGKICHKHNCLLAIDAVVSFCTTPLFVDRWGVDAVVAASQKGVSCPPGLVFLTFSEQAQKRMMDKKTPPPLYFDIMALSATWNCFGKPRRYHYTYNTNMLCAAREALAIIAEEGLDNVWNRHKKCAEAFWEGLKRIGLEPFVQKPENRFCGVTPVCVPPQVRWPVLLKYILDKYQCDMGFGVGPTQDKAIRVGFLGYNARPEVVEFALHVIEDGMKFALSVEGQNGPCTRSEML